MVHIVFLRLAFVYWKNILRYRTLDTIQIPFELADDLAVLICNSNVRHELSHSEYPTRRNQCAQALELMRLNSYKDATIKSLDGKYPEWKERSVRWKSM